MNNLPDDLRALEAKLGELVPSNSLDTDRLIFEAGYAAALAQQGSSTESARTLMKMAGSALVGIAATLLAITTWPDTRAVPEVTTIPRVTQQRTEPPATSRAQLAVNASQATDPTNRQVDVSPQLNQTYSTGRWRDRLLESDSQWSNAWEVQTVDLPANGDINVRNDRQPTNLQWQTELFQDVSSSTRGST